MKDISLTDDQIELLLKCLQTFIEIQKLINPKKYSTENELQKIFEYTDLYEILAEQFYEEKNYFKKIS